MSASAGSWRKNSSRTDGRPLRPPVPPGVRGHRFFRSAPGLVVLSSNRFTFPPAFPPGRQETPMQDRFYRISRRKFLASAAALTLSGAGAEGGEALPPAFRTRPPKPAIPKRQPLAVLTTVYRPLSHAYHIAGRFLNGYTTR